MIMVGQEQTVAIFSIALSDFTFRPLTDLKIFMTASTRRCMAMVRKKSKTARRMSPGVLSRNSDVVNKAEELHLRH